VQVVDTLRRVPLFSKVPEDKLAWIAGHGEEKESAGLNLTEWYSPGRRLPLS
jgi:hypothetical protein